MSKLEKLLAAICATPTCVHFSALKGLLGWERPQIRTVMLVLHRRGYAQALRPHCWRATAAGRDAYETIKAACAHNDDQAKAAALHIPERPNGFVSRIWTAMRCLRKFRIDDLVRMAALEGDNIKNRRDETRRFVAKLTSAGYLVRMDQEKRHTSKAKYLLPPDRDTGPKVPAVCKGRIVDRNTGAIIQLGGIAA